MPALREFQASFGAALLHAGDAEAAFVASLEQADAEARRRLAVYRRNVFGAMTGALRASDPVVERIVGAPFFRHAAEAYIHAQPSASGDLNDFGGAFAAFLADFAPAASLAYLPDVARLEWQVQRLHFVAAPAAADLSAVAAVPAAQWLAAKFTFHDAWVRQDSAWPLAQIWRVNQPDHDGDMTVGAAPGMLLAWREEHAVRVADLSAGEARFFDALAAGNTLSFAAGEGAADAGFALTPALAGLLQRGLVRDITF